MFMNVAMLHCGDSPHPAHQGFADAVNADLYGLNRVPVEGISNTIPAEILRGLQVNSYDIYIAEGTRALYGAIASQLAKDSLLIYLAADQSLFELQHYDGGSRFVNRLISRYGMELMKKTFSRFIDGVIAVSNFVADYTREMIDVPVRIAHPYIQPNIYQQLDAVSPSLRKKTAITVGSYSWYKGQDILPGVWARVQDEHPNAELYLVGSGYPSHFNNISGITVCGYVSDLPAALSRAALYVHSARADAFPVSVLEGLRAGLPAVVTTTTGTKSVVESVNEEMVSKRSVDGISTAIINYFDTSFEKRQSMSQSARVNSSPFDRDSRKSAFAEEFKKLIYDTSSGSLS